MQHNKKKLLILGAGGLLGSELVNNECFHEWEIVEHRRQNSGVQNADLTNSEAVFSMLDKVSPDAIVNLVGMTNVDRCEQFPNEAYMGNVKSLENVVRWIKHQKRKVYLVHISTDQVYDGEGPHSEENVALKNYYAFAKYTSELVASSVNSVILRTNFFGKSQCAKRSSLTDWIYQSLKEGQQIQVFEDVLFSPLSMYTLAGMIALVLQKNITGVYNLGSHEGMSKADFAFKFARLLNLNTSLMTRNSTDNVDFLKTYRPKDMRLNVGAFEKATGVFLPLLDDEIIKVSLEYKNET